MHDVCYKVYRNFTWLVYKVYWNSARMFDKVYWNYAQPFLQGLLEVCTICVTRSTGMLHGLFTRSTGIPHGFFTRSTGIMHGLCYKVFWNYARFVLHGLPAFYMACLQGSARLFYKVYWNFAQPGFTRSSGIMHDFCYKVYRNCTWLVYKVYWHSARLFLQGLRWNYARPLLQGLNIQHLVKHFINLFKHI